MDEGTKALATLNALLDLAHETAAHMHERSDPSHVELLAALATSRLCVLRLVAEEKFSHPRQARDKQRC